MNKVQTYKDNLLKRMMQIRDTFQAHGCECQARACEVMIDEARKPIKINDKPHLVRPFGGK